MYNGLFISLLGFQSGYFEELLRYFLFDIAEMGLRVETLFFHYPIHILMSIPIEILFKIGHAQFQNKEYSQK